MANNKNDVSSIGNRIGRLIQQYELRIRYAEYKAKLMAEEEKRASASGLDKKAMYAKIARLAWEVYQKNLSDKRDDLLKEIKGALICYNSKEKQIWWLYFIENKSSYDIETETNFNARAVQRTVAAMKSDMELKFESLFHRNSGLESPNWSAADLANFLTERPSDDYLAAVKDMLQYGIVDLDALEFDPMFQKYLDNGCEHKVLEELLTNGLPKEALR